MSDTELAHVKDLPDEAVLTEQQAARLLNISVETLKRLDQSHDGPPLVWLSPRRKGRPLGGLRRWLGVSSHLYTGVSALASAVGQSTGCGYR